MKPWAYALIIFALIAFVGGVYAKGHSSGYDKRGQEIQNEILEAVAAAEAKKDEEWAVLVAAAEGQIVTEEVIREVIREVEVKIPTVVERIVEVTPECADLGAEYAGVLNDQVRAGNGVQDPEPTSDPDSGM